MIPNLTPTDPTANPETQRVSYEPAVLTVAGVSSYNPQEQISFKEVEGFWKLPQSLIQAMRVPPIGSVVLASLTTKPKPPGPNTRAGSKYMDIDHIVAAAAGSAPIAPQAQQQAPPPSAGDPRDDWGNEPQQATQAVSGDVGLTIDEKIKKSQALNLLFDAVSAPMVPEDRVKLVKAMGFESVMEANNVAGEQWQQLRGGKTPFTEEPGSKPEPTHEAGMAPAEPDEWAPAPDDGPDGWGSGEKIPGY